MSKEQVVAELHRSARRHFSRRKTIIRGLNETFQADLVEMIPYAAVNRNFKYILTVIDIFSKYAWAVPIKTKTAENVTKAMQTIFNSSKRIPKNMHTDQGKEFFNKHFGNLMEKHGINHYSTYSTKKAAIVERFNRTLKNKMWKMFSLEGSYNWLTSLPKLVAEYNRTKHRTIRMRPIDVNEQNEQRLLKTIYNIDIHVNGTKRKKFKVNDYVRISKYKSDFGKGYTPNWTSEIFQIYRVQGTSPETYLLKDYEGNPIKGGFYGYEIQKVKHPNVYLVEKILQRNGNKVYVKWLGFDERHNSWIDANKLL